jgi:dihydrofolate reductase
VHIVSKLVVECFTVSLDGFGAGPNQDESNPLGVRGRELHGWIYATKAFREMVGESGGSEGVDNDFFKGNLEEGGATIMGRNMFGPIRGPWKGSDWQGWWGPDPPHHHDVFVLTHHERPDLTLSDTTFHFVTQGIEVALERARDAANGKDISLAGGASTILQYLDARLVDKLVLAVAPIEMGSGERLLPAVGEWPNGFECVSVTEGEGATFYTLLPTSSA